MSDFQGVYLSYKESYDADPNDPNGKTLEEFHVNSMMMFEMTKTRIRMFMKIRYKYNVAYEYSYCNGVGLGSNPRLSYRHITEEKTRTDSLPYNNQNFFYAKS